METEKKDYYDEMLAISRNIQDTVDRYDDNRRDTRLATEMEYYSRQLHHDQQRILDELGYCWKGQRATIVIGDAQDASNEEYHQMMGALDLRQTELERDRATLLRQEEDLRHEAAQLAYERDMGR